MNPHEKLRQILTNARILPDLVRLIPVNCDCWLVGGALRDCLLGLDSTDYDFALACDPTSLAKDYAGALDGTWFPLDRERNQSRVVAGPPEKRVSYDFAPLRAPILKQDLERRDFTINALALPLHAGGFGALLDLLGGAGDLEAKTLRACSPLSMQEDPLRVLKGVRHAAMFHLDIEGRTGEWMATAVPALQGVAPERIGYETARLLGLPSPVSALDLLRRTGGVQALIGKPLSEIDYRGLDRTLRRCEKLRTLIETKLNLAGDSLGADRMVEGEWSLLGLAHLALLARGTGCRENDVICRRLALGRRAGRILKRLLETSSADLGHLGEVAPRSRSRALWLDSLNVPPEAALLIMTALAAGSVEDISGVGAALIGDFRREAPGGKVIDLVDGDWVKEKLGRPAGPRVGQVLRELRKAEIDGLITTVKDAEKFLENLGG